MFNTLLPWRLTIMLIVQLHKPIRMACASLDPPFTWHHPGSLIADIGTGTGLWAIEVANQRPGSTIVGLDVDLVQTPPKEWLPPNVQMHKLDLLADDVPPEWEGAFK